jgi:hypothetical protein
MRKFLNIFFVLCQVAIALSGVPEALADAAHADGMSLPVFAGPGAASWTGDTSLPRSPRSFETVLAQNTPAVGKEPLPGPVTGEKPEEMTFWAWLWDYLYNGASITVGVGTRQAELTVTRLNDGASGRIVQRDEEAYFLSYSTRPSFLGDSQFGYTFMLNYTTFNLDKQEVAKNTFEDIGTRVRGKVAYVVPTLFYQWGEHQKKGKFVRLGVGAGLGIAKFEGDIILNDAANTRVSVANGSYGLKFALSAFLEARYRHWGVRLSAAGPTYQDETYRYALSDIAVNLGYSWYF